MRKCGSQNWVLKSKRVISLYTQWFCLPQLPIYFRPFIGLGARPGIFTLRHFGAKFCHLSGLPYHVTRAELNGLNGWLQETSTFFGVVQKITRRRDTGYDAWSNNKCTAFIWVKENSRPKSNQDELLLANGTIKGKYSIAVDLGVSCGHFDHATDSPEQEHLDALEVNVTPDVNTHTHFHKSRKTTHNFAVSLEDGSMAFWEFFFGSTTPHKAAILLAWQFCKRDLFFWTVSENVLRNQRIY